MAGPLKRRIEAAARPRPGGPLIIVNKGTDASRRSNHRSEDGRSNASGEFRLGLAMSSDIRKRAAARAEYPEGRARIDSPSSGAAARPSEATATDACHILRRMWESRSQGLHCGMVLEYWQCCVVRPENRRPEGAQKRLCRCSSTKGIPGLAVENQIVFGQF